MTCRPPTRPDYIPAAEWESQPLPKGTVLVYVGPNASDSNPITDGEQPFDLGVNASVSARDKTLRNCCPTTSITATGTSGRCFRSPTPSRGRSTAPTREPSRA